MTLPLTLAFLPPPTVPYSTVSIYCVSSLSQAAAASAGRHPRPRSRGPPGRPLSHRLQQESLSTLHLTPRARGGIDRAHDIALYSRSRELSLRISVERRTSKKATFICQLGPPCLARQFVGARMLLGSTVGWGTAERTRTDGKKVVLDP